MADINDDRWCILRTAGVRTLPLVASLNDAGIEAWTPTGKSMRRQGKNRDKVKVPCPIMPTFVFARYRHLPELHAARAMLVSPHPAFSFFKRNGGIPSVSDAALDRVRVEERRQSPRYLPKGALVTMPSGSWTGMTGVIERQEGKMLVLLFPGFGGTVEVKIDPCELPDDAVDTGSSTKDVAA